MTAQTQRTILGHPRGLFVLFFTEMWERFNYYGMRALLTLYMVNYLRWPQEDSSRVYKWFTSLVYLTPLLGGFLADRYLGNKWAIVLGSLTMAIGQFCMTIDNEKIFLFSLGLLVCGNGLFKPNMATQVGRLYPPNDPRRDSAYTIFYMGVNLGAFIAPLACAWLRVNTSWGFKAGFAAAGVGMLIGLVTYLAFVHIVNRDTEFAASLPPATPKESTSGAVHYMTEKEAATTPSTSPVISGIAPQLMLLGAILLATVPWILCFGFDLLNFDNAAAYSFAGTIAGIMGWYVLGRTTLAARDRVLVIFVMGAFVIFFWGAFEQSGNAMNIFADKTTNRYVTESAPAPSVYPLAEGESEAKVGGATGWTSVINPVPTEYFQSINPLAIILFAPLFAWLWVALPRIGILLSTPAKMAVGIFVQGMAFALMYWSIRYEAQPSSAPLAALPPGVIAEADGRVVFRDAPNLDDEAGLDAYASFKVDQTNSKIVQGGRIRFDASKKQLEMTGVLSDTDRDRLLRATASTDYLKKVREFVSGSRKAKAEKGDAFTFELKLDSPPPQLDLRYSGLKKDAVKFDPTTGVLSTTIELGDRDYKGLLVAGADLALREAMNKLLVDSSRFRVSAWWLVLFYVLSTFGELCLSPLGLSMVSKLAPAAYATIMMGMWHVMISFGNYAAGQLGENYGTLDPGVFFLRIGVALAVVSMLCLVVVKVVKRMMHGVN